MSEIASRVKAIIVDKLGVDEKEVTKNIPADQAETIKTVGDAINYIEANQKA